jgi:UDP-N-acetylmuramate: L-alanyl-gamma-D-glutamyl-meso-diaminopimelate ligase
MKMGVHRDTLAASLAAADEVWLYTPADLGWDAGQVVASLGERGHGATSVDTLATQLAQSVRPGDQVLIMSNGGFGGLHGKLLKLLAARHGAVAGV